jgi:hypothetical protein
MVFLMQQQQQKQGFSATVTPGSTASSIAPQGIPTVQLMMLNSKH